MNSLKPGDRCLVEAVIAHPDWHRDTVLINIGDTVNVKAPRSLVHPFPLPATQGEPELTFMPMCACGHDQGWHSAACDFSGCQCGDWQPLPVPPSPVGGAGEGVGR